MNLTEEIEIICKTAMGRCGTGGVLFWELLKVNREMAKRIEALERQLDSDARANGYAHTIFHR